MGQEQKDNIRAGLSKRFQMFSPDGVKYEGTNLKAFCLERDLDQSAMSAYASRKIPTPQGLDWKLHKGA